MNTLVVDLDDTLVDTQPLYSAAEASFFTFMDQIGFPRHEVEPVFRKINIDFVDTYGFGRRYFGNIMGKTYVKIMEAAGRTPKRSDIRLLIATGDTVYSRTPQMIPFAHQALSMLKLTGEWDLILYSAGVPEVQQR